MNYKKIIDFLKDKWVIVLLILIIICLLCVRLLSKKKCLCVEKYSKTIKENNNDINKQIEKEGKKAIIFSEAVKSGQKFYLRYIKKIKDNNGIEKKERFYLSVVNVKGCRLPEKGKDCWMNIPILHKTLDKESSTFYMSKWDDPHVLYHDRNGERFVLNQLLNVKSDIPFMCFDFYDSSDVNINTFTVLKVRPKKVVLEFKHNNKRYHVGECLGGIDFAICHQIGGDISKRLCLYSEDFVPDKNKTDPIIAFDLIPAEEVELEEHEEQEEQEEQVLSSNQSSSIEHPTVEEIDVKSVYAKSSMVEEEQLLTMPTDESTMQTSSVQDVSTLKLPTSANNTFSITEGFAMMHPDIQKKKPYIITANGRLVRI